MKINIKSEVIKLHVPFCFPSPGKTWTHNRITTKTHTCLGCLIVLHLWFTQTKKISDHSSVTIILVLCTLTCCVNALCGDWYRMLWGNYTMTKSRECINGGIFCYYGNGNMTVYPLYLATDASSSGCLVPSLPWEWYMHYISWQNIGWYHLAIPPITWALSSMWALSLPLHPFRIWLAYTMRVNLIPVTVARVTRQLVCKLCTKWDKTALQKS